MCACLQMAGNIVVALPIQGACPMPIAKVIQEQFGCIDEIPSMYRQANINGYTYRVPHNKGKITSLAAFQPSDAHPVMFGNVVVFFEFQSKVFAVVAHRQIVQLSLDPFFVCVENDFTERALNVVDVCNFICPCSEFVLPYTNPSCSMVMFHQASQHVRPFVPV